MQKQELRLRLPTEVVEANPDLKLLQEEGASALLQMLPAGIRFDLYRQAMDALLKKGEEQHCKAVCNLSRQKFKNLFLVVPLNPLNRSYLHGTPPVKQTDLDVFHPAKLSTHELPNVVMSNYEEETVSAWLAENTDAIWSYRQQRLLTDGREVDKTPIQESFINMVRSLRDTRHRVHSIERN